MVYDSKPLDLGQEPPYKEQETNKSLINDRFVGYNAYANTSLQLILYSLKVRPHGLGSEITEPWLGNPTDLIDTVIRDRSLASGIR